jgi:hypothetical protein
MATSIPLRPREAKWAVIQGLCKSTGSEGPVGTEPGAAVARIYKAPANDIQQGVVLPEDYLLVTGLALETFVAGDCAVFTDDKKAETWERILDALAGLWTLTPSLTGPFPRDKFPRPAMDCHDTRVVDLANTARDQWKGAQS